MSWAASPVYAKGEAPQELTSPSDGFVPVLNEVRAALASTHTADDLKINLPCDNAVFLLVLDTLKASHVKEFIKTSFNTSAQLTLDVVKVAFPGSQAAKAIDAGEYLHAALSLVNGNRDAAIKKIASETLGAASSLADRQRLTESLKLSAEGLVDQIQKSGELAPEIVRMTAGECNAKVLANFEPLNERFRIEISGDCNCEERESGRYTRGSSPTTKVKLGAWTAVIVGDAIPIQKEGTEEIVFQPRIESIAIFARCCQQRKDEDGHITTVPGPERKNLFALGRPPTVIALAEPVPSTAVTTLQDCLKTGLVSMNLYGDGQSTTDTELVLTNNKTGIVASAKLQTMCISNKDKKPPPSPEVAKSENLHYELAGPADPVLVSIVENSRAIAAEHGYDDLPLAPDRRQQTVAQMAVWKSLGDKTTTPIDDVTPAAIGDQVLKQAGVSRQSLSPEEVKAVNDRANQIFTAVNLTLKGTTTGIGQNPPELPEKPAQKPENADKPEVPDHKPAQKTPIISKIPIIPGFQSPGNQSATPAKLPDVLIDRPKDKPLDQLQKQPPPPQPPQKPEVPDGSGTPRTPIISNIPIVPGFQSPANQPAKPDQDKESPVPPGEAENGPFEGFTTIHRYTVFKPNNQEYQEMMTTSETCLLCPDDMVGLIPRENQEISDETTTPPGGKTVTEKGEHGEEITRENYPNGDPKTVTVVHPPVETGDDLDPDPAKKRVEIHKVETKEYEPGRVKVKHTETTEYKTLQGPQSEKYPQKTVTKIREFSGGRGGFVKKEVEIEETVTELDDRGLVHTRRVTTTRTYKDRCDKSPQVEVKVERYDPVKRQYVPEEPSSEPGKTSK